MYWINLLGTCSWFIRQMFYLHSSVAGVVQGGRNPREAVGLNFGTDWHWGIRDHSVYEPSQWETALHCNAVSLWLGTYTEWSLGFWATSQYKTLFFYQVWEFHNKHKTVVRLSYLYNGNSYTGKMASLFWDSTPGSSNNGTSSGIKNNVHLHVQMAWCLFH